MSVKLNYRVEGVGPPALLLHPVGIDLTFLDAVAARLATEFAVMRADLRGHGKSPFAASPNGLMNYADDVHALLDGTGFGPCAVVGFAFGGMVAQALAVKYPQDATALLIASCPSAHTPESAAMVKQRGADALRDGIGSILDVTMRRWFNDAFVDAGGDKAVRAHLLSADIRGWADAWTAMATIDTAPRLKEIKVPTLCLVGEFDKSAPPSNMKTTADLIPGARFHVIPGAPHMPFIEQPDETARIVRDFLRDALQSSADA